MESNKRAKDGQKVSIKRKIRCKRHGSIAFIELANRPLNVLSNVMREELLGAFAELSNDSNVRAVVLKGEGERAFCAGSDVREFVQEMEQGAGGERASFERSFVCDILQFPKPVIAALDGYVLGGGLELALLCDFRIASMESRLGFPEVNLGGFPANAVMLCRQLIGESKTKELMYLGHWVTAEEAHRLGLVNRVVAQETVVKETYEFASELVTKAPESLRATKAIINGWTQRSIGLVGGQVEQLMAYVWELEETRKSVKAFFERKVQRPKEGDTTQSPD